MPVHLSSVKLHDDSPNCFELEKFGSMASWCSRTKFFLPVMWQIVGLLVSLPRQKGWSQAIYKHASKSIFHHVKQNGSSPFLKPFDGSVFFLSFLFFSRRRRSPSSRVPCVTKFTPCRRGWLSTWRPTARRSRICAIRSGRLAPNVSNPTVDTRKHVMWFFLSVWQILQEALHIQNAPPDASSEYGRQHVSNMHFV